MKRIRPPTFFAAALFALGVPVLRAHPPGPAQTASTASAAEKKVQTQLRRFQMEMTQQRPAAALKTVTALCREYPTYSLAWTYRAIADGRLGRWPAARADIARARSLQLPAQYRTYFAITLVHGPTAADHALARRYIWQALDAHVPSLLAESAFFLLARVESGTAYLRDVKSHNVSPSYHQWAVGSYASYLQGNSWVGDGLKEIWGDYTRIRPRLTTASMQRRQSQRRAAKLVSWFRQARTVLGDSGGLEADWMLWELHEQQVSAALTRWRVAAARFSNNAFLRRAGDAVCVAAARAMLRVGDAHAVLKLLSKPPVTGRQGAILRARALAATGQYRAAQALLTRTMLRQGAPGPQNRTVQLMHVLESGGDSFAAALLQQSAAQHRDVLYWQGRLAFSAHHYGIAAQALRASTVMRQGVHPGAMAMLALSLARSGHPRQAAQEWQQVRLLAGPGLWPLFRRLGESGRSATVSVQGKVANVFCHKGAVIGVDLRDGSLRFPLRLTHAIQDVPRNCGVVFRPMWGVGRAVPSASQFPQFLGTLESWHPGRGFSDFAPPPVLTRHPHH